jgi:hypothetical protein
MMTNERLNPLNDYLFMKYMGEKGDEEQLISFLNAVLQKVKFRRLQEKDIVNNHLHRWLTFFDKSTDDKILEEIIQMDTAIQKAQERIRFVRGSEEEFRAYQMREMALSDLTDLPIEEVKNILSSLCHDA